MNISSEQLKSMIESAFLEGQLWGVTYSTWFKPTEEQHKEKLYEAMVTVERLLMGKEVTKKVIDKVCCFSCNIEFEVEDQNDKPEGYFCDKCIINDN